MTEEPDLLTDAIRKLVRKGSFSHLSLTCSGGDFHASFRGVDHTDQRIAQNADPVAALHEALTGKRQAKPARAQPPRRLMFVPVVEPKRPKPARDFDELLG